MHAARTLDRHRRGHRSRTAAGQLLLDSIAVDVPDNIGALERLHRRTLRQIDREGDPAAAAVLEARAGDLAHQRGRLAFLEAMQAYDEAVQAGHADGAPALDAERAWTRRAAAHYGQALAFDPDLPGADQTLFLYAGALQQLSRRDEAIAIWKRLLDAHPTSIFRDRAQLQLAEHAFDDADVAGALPRYLEVAEGGGTLAAFAGYKVAWCRYNLGDIDGAVDAMIPVATGGGVIAREAVKDVVRFAASYPDPAHADQALELACEDDAACLDMARTGLERIRGAR